MDGLHYGFKKIAILAFKVCLVGLNAHLQISKEFMDFLSDGRFDILVHGRVTFKMRFTHNLGNEPGDCLIQRKEFTVAVHVIDNVLNI